MSDTTTTETPPTKAPKAIKGTVATTGEVLDLRDKQKPPADRTPIPVRRLRMRNDMGLEFPGCQGKSTVESKPEDFGKSVAHWIIEYLPWMRHHRVTWHQAGGDKEPVVEMFHEAIVSWRPM